jgi:hypothetical protein
MQADKLSKYWDVERCRAKYWNIEMNEGIILEYG